VLVASGVLLAAANATWLTVGVRDAPDAVAIAGSDAAPALSGIALAAVACVGALSIAPRVLRWVLAGVLTLLGVAAVLVPLPILADPPSGAERTVSGVTGISGSEAVRALITSVDVTPWPVVAVVAAVAIVAAAIGIAVTARSWPATGRRYEGPDGAPSADPWDALTQGSDPTSGPER
jgi:hypothetical protein